MIIFRIIIFFDKDNMNKNFTNDIPVQICVILNKPDNSSDNENQF